MKSFLKPLTLLLLFFFFLSLPGFAESRPDLWKKVDEAKAKGLPQTAIEALNSIYEQAIKDKAMVDAVKALCEKIVQEGNIQGNKPEEKIVRLEEEIKKADSAFKPLLNIILAKWYWHYYNHNSYRFLNRSRTEGLADKDFTTWDLPRLFAHIGNLYENVLNEEKKLRAIPVTQLNGFLEMGNQPVGLRPTLFDFFAHEALTFYMADAQSAAKPIRAFEIEASSPALAGRDAFLNWQPDAFDKDSCNYRAVIILQRLLSEVTTKDNRDSLLDNDLIRLVWAKRIAVGDNISETYINTLTNFAKANADHPYEATALGLAAAEYLSLKNFVRAIEIAEQGSNKWPGSHGETICRSVIAMVLAKEINIDSERIVLPSDGNIKVSFRNIEKVYFRLVPRELSELTAKNSYSPDQINWDDYSKILSRKAIQSWNIDLDPGKEYIQCEAIVNLPEIKTGMYYLLASVREDFSESQNCLQLAPIIVTNLGMVIRKKAAKTEVFVVNNESGVPMVDVKVKGYIYDYDKGWRQPLSGTTDKDGLVSFDPQRNSGFVVAEHQGQVIYKNVDFYEQGGYSFSSGTNVYFFTDRSIYRPGQTVYFKGILASFDQRSNEYKTIANTNVSVNFRDPNSQQVKLQSFKTNEFGSFSGTFLAPADRLTGQYSINAENFSGMAQIRIEEYKRPKFKVEIDTPVQSYQLDQLVQLSGRAIAYTGAKIDNAQVKYRVVREVRFPPWCWWYFDAGSSQEIAHGTAVTDANGEFSIKFTAKPDRTVAKDSEPTFIYTVSADVVDGTGETRSGSQAVRIGYTALGLTLGHPDVTEDGEPIKLNITTTTLDGKGIAGAGSLLIYSLKQPARAQRKSYFTGVAAAKADKSNIRTWEEDQVVFEETFNTSIDGNFSCETKLPVGAYRIKAQSRDRYNTQVNAIAEFMVINCSSDEFPIKIPFFFKITSGELQPGKLFTAFWATGYDKGPAYIEIEHRNNIIKAFWTNKDLGKVNIELPVTENHRGGFNVRVMQIKENREYIQVQYVPVPWNNKNLKLRFAHMTSKMQPAQKDTWKIEISGDEAEKGAIEMVAAMYDASLDAFADHSWTSSFPAFYTDTSRLNASFANQATSLYVWQNNLNSFPNISHRSYPQLPHNIQNDFFGFAFARGGMLMKSMAPSGARSMELQSVAPMMMESRKMESDSFADQESSANEAMSVMESNTAPTTTPVAATGKEPDLDKVSARQNLNETAFFFPHLTAGEDGTVAIEFTMPEALTTWKFLGFAHGNKLQAGSLTGETITQKDLMVQPNAPRFLREGDKLGFTAKVTNLSASEQKGKLRLTLSDPVNDTNRNSEFKLTNDTLEFAVPAGESRSFAWTLDVPETPGVVKYKVVGATPNLSDGEEGLLPILSRRIFVTESMPLPINGPASKKFTFKKLVDSGKSATLKSQGLTLEVTSNPAWYAVQALPYLMEFPHECSEQIFNRIYANHLASFIARSDPKIKKVFDTWKADEANGGKALFSNLEKNEHLKAVALLETPWVLDAKSETEQKHKIGVLFDTNRLEHEMARAGKKLAEMQMSDGGFPWFPGGRPNSYITLYIMTGFGRMHHLGVDIDMTMALKSLTHLDNWINEVYQKLIKFPGYKTNTNISSITALYLYGRSFFLKAKPIPASSKEAVDFFIGEAKKKWLDLNSRQSQGHLALALQRFGEKTIAADIVKSVKERSVYEEEMGRFWRENELSFWWYRAEIETQAVMIEMFSEVSKDDIAVEQCKIWLLKQKQTQNWKTTKATADAIYALLLRGADLLASDKIVKVILGGNEVKPEKTEAGTGYYQKIYPGVEVKPAMGNIELIKEDKGVAWGAVHWQYLEDMSKVTPHETNLKLKKTLFVKKDTDKGPTIKPLHGNLKVGDLLVVRIELRTDRDMEYIHMKDQRGSGLEPINVISSYRYQDGLAYYEATKDTATHFYIDYLPKGTYVFEYDLRVQHQGTYQTGMAEIQCMYAPEFNSHSESFVVNVKE